MPATPTSWPCSSRKRGAWASKCGRPTSTCPAPTSRWRRALSATRSAPSRASASRRCCRSKQARARRLVHGPAGFRRTRRRAAGQPPLLRGAGEGRSVPADRAEPRARRSSRRRCCRPWRRRRRNSATRTRSACSATSQRSAAPAGCFSVGRVRPAGQRAGQRRLLPVRATRWTTCSMASMRARITLAAEREIVGAERQFLDMIGVVRARVEKPAKAGGKFAIVTLSDPSGEYELFVNDELLQNSRDILEVGERVIVPGAGAQGRRRAALLDGQREEAVAGRRSARTRRFCAPQRRRAAGPHRQRGVRACRRARPRARGAHPYRDPGRGRKVVTIALEGRYPVDFGAMQAFKSVPGVDQVRPAAA